MTDWSTASNADGWPGSGPVRGLIVITGASAKIGGDTVLHLGRTTPNPLLLCCLRHPTRVESLAGQIPTSDGRRVEVVRADLTTDSGLRVLVDSAIGLGLPIAGVVHFASAAETCALEDIDRARLRRAMAVDVEAAALLVGRLLPHFASGASVVLAGGSMVTHVPLARQTVYSAAKTALKGMMRGMTAELAAVGVRINLIELGIVGAERDAEVVETAGPLMPMQRAGRPEELAQLVRFLLSTQASYLTGQSVPFAGGL